MCFETKAYILCILGGLLWQCSSTTTPSEPAAASAENDAKNDSDELEKTEIEALATPETETPSGKISLKKEKLKPYLFSKDGYPRIRKYFIEENSTKTQKIQKLEYDFNGDGRVDFIENYHPTEQYIQSESSDLDGDGTLEITAFYEKALIVFEPVRRADHRVI